MARHTLSWHHAATLGIIAMVSACANAPSAHQAANPPPVSPGPGATWYSVHFDTASFVIPPGSQAAINDATAFLRQHPTAVATIIGKTDSVGGADYNMHLSHQRADAVRDALVYGAKIPADHVETRWTGETRLDHPTASDVAAADNRVVDIAIHY
jgi:outer membrane protein OmpA-like peptidoglycan-associated protein